MNSCYPFINTPLPYPYHALEPFIDEKTLHLHHDKHLQTYIDNLNALLKEHPMLQKCSLEELLISCCRLPDSLQISIGNNAGGVYNHRFFFDGMGNDDNLSMDDFLLLEINKHFCNFDQFKNQFKQAALSVFGSGYAWLVLDNGRLKITTTSNQDTPLEKHQYPLLNLDVWEHAYYLKHYNVRAAYVDDWFHVVNWHMVSLRLEKWLSFCT